VELKLNVPFGIDVAKVKLTKYFDRTTQNTSKSTTEVHVCCCYLTDHEEHSLVQLCTVLGSMGYSLTHEDLHGFADSIINKDVDDHEHVSISKHIVASLLM